MCDVCMALNEKLRITSLSDIELERRAYAKAKDEHLRVVREDRYGYEILNANSNSTSQRISRGVDEHNNRWI